MKSRTRREFMATAARTTAAAAATALTPGYAAQVRAAPKPTARPKVALVATVVRKLSHAQHFLDRLLEGYGWHGEHHHPPMDLVSMYVDQFPPTDLSRERSKRHNVPIYPTIAEALTRGRIEAGGRWGPDYRRAWRVSEERNRPDALSALLIFQAMRERVREERPGGAGI